MWGYAGRVACVGSGRTDDVYIRYVNFGGDKPSPLSVYSVCILVGITLAVDNTYTDFV